MGTKHIGSALAELGATLFMEYASTWLYNRQSDTSRQREEQPRTEMPTTTLVRKTAALARLNFDDERAQKLGMLTHYGFGAAGGPAALLLTASGIGPLKASLSVATAMEVFVDQGMNTALRLTPHRPGNGPGRRTHVGVAAHAIYGAALGLLLAAGSDA